jgi:flagellar hook-associated protein 2
MANPITSSGLASGIDTNAILAQLVQIQRIPIQKLQQRQSDIGLKAAKLSDITTKLNALKTAAEELDTIGKLLSYNATVGDGASASATATGDASPGLYTLRVNNLAKAEKNLSTGFSSSTATASAGTITITTNDGAADAKTTAVALSGATSLADVVSAINGADAGVTATIINDGLGTATSHKIQLTATATGFTSATASQAVVVDSGTTGLGFAESVTAENASLVLDGQTISRTSNTISDLITGVNLTLLDEPGTDTTLEVKTDPEGVEEKLQEFVDAYNGVMNLLLKELKVSKDTKRPQSLASEPAIRSLEQAMDQIVSSTVGSTGGPFESLAAIGIKTTQTGTLTLDSDVLATAISTNSSSLAQVFTKDSTGIVPQITDLVEQYADSLSGRLITTSKSLTSMTKNITDRIATLETRVDSYAARLRRQFTAMEQTIAGIQAQGNRFTAIIGSV